jgi:hypothetical protein
MLRLSKSTAPKAASVTPYCWAYTLGKCTYTGKATKARQAQQTISSRGLALHTAMGVRLGQRRSWLQALQELRTHLGLGGAFVEPDAKKQSRKIHVFHHAHTLAVDPKFGPFARAG